MLFSFEGLVFENFSMSECQPTSAVRLASGRPSVSLATLVCRLCAVLILGPQTLSAGTFTNIFGGAWESSDSWSDNQVPSNFGDSATIGVYGLYTVTLNTDIVISSLTLNQVFVTLSVSRSLELAGDFNWYAGIVTGDPAHGELISDGSLSMPITPGQDYSGLDKIELLNQGLGVLSGGGGFVLQNGAYLLNGLSGDFTLGGNVDLIAGGTGANYLWNSGTLHRGGDSGTNKLLVNFVQQGSLQVDSGTLVLLVPSTNSGDNIISGTLAFFNTSHLFSASSTVSGSGNFTISSGQVEMLGRFGCSNLNVSAGSISFDGTNLISPRFVNLGGTLSGTNDVNVGGGLTWTNGFISGSNSVEVDGNLLLSGNLSLSGRTLHSFGPGTWTNASGSLAMSGGARLVNYSNFDCAVNGTIVNGGGSNSVLNLGYFDKSAFGGTLNCGVNFINFPDAIAEVITGTLALNGGSENDGAILVDSGATLTLGSGFHSFTTDSSLVGIGNLTVAAADANADLQGNVELDGTTTFSSGLANISGDFHNNVVVISGGTANFNGTTNTVEITNLVVSSGVLGGTNLVSVSGPMAWNGGAISGASSVLANGGLTLSGTNLSLSYRTLVNYGLGTWAAPAGTLAMSAEATLINFSNFDCAVNGNIVGDSGTNFIINAGYFSKSAVGGTLNCGVRFANDASAYVEIESGTLELSGGSLISGNVIVDSGAALTLGSGPHLFSADSTLVGGNLNVAAPDANAMLQGYVELDGTGTFSSGSADISGEFTNNTAVISGGTANFNGTNTAQLATLNVSSGTLGGSNFVNVSGQMAWSGGAISGTNFVIADGLTLSGTNLSLSGRTLANAGAGTWSGPSGSLSMSGSATLLNLSNFDCSVNGTIVNGGGSNYVLNVGTFTKSGDGTLNCGVKFVNGLGGGVEIKSGTLQLSGGSESSSAIVVDSGGTLAVAGGTNRFLSGGSVSGKGNWDFMGDGTTIIACPVNLTGSNRFIVGTATFSDSYTGNVVSISGGSAIFNCLTNATMSALNLLGGTLGGSNLVNVAGPVLWQGGAISSSNVVIAGLPNITNAVQLDMTGTNLIFSGGTLVNVGLGIWTNLSGAALAMSGGSVLSNALGAIFKLAGDVTINNGGGSNFWVNLGQLIKSAGVGTANCNVRFDNSGSVQVQSGTLSLNGGGTETGSFATLAQAVLALNGGTYSFPPLSSVLGDGDFVVSGATLADIQGSVDLLGSNIFNGGTATFSGSYTCRAVNISGGSAIFNGLSNATMSALTLLSGTLGGSNIVNVAGPLLWQGGVITGFGPVIAGIPSLTNDVPQLTMSGNNLSLSGRTLVNVGFGLWTNISGTVLGMSGGGVLSNALGAIFKLATDATINNGSGANAFINLGQLIKSAGLGTANCNVAFNSSGTVQIQSGTLSLNAGGAETGPFTISSNATLALAPGTGNFTFTPASSITGGNFTVGGATADIAGPVVVNGTNNFSGGTVSFDGGFMGNIVNISGGPVFGATVNFNGGSTNTNSIAALNFNGGTIGGSNLVTVTGPTTWTAGAIVGSNSLVAAGGLKMLGANLSLSGRTLVNLGAGLWTNSAGAFSLAGGALFSNAPSANFDWAADGAVNAGAGANAIANAGLFRKTAGVNSLSVFLPFNNSGTVEIWSGNINLSSSPYTQISGLTLLRGGNLVNLSPLQILGGRLQGSGQIFGSVTNAGTLQPGDTNGLGQLTISGSYTQAAGGAFNLVLTGQAPLTGFAPTVVSNTATLAGALNVGLANGFVPAVNSTFTFLTHSNRLGAFTSFTYPSNLVGMALVYTASNVAIQVTSVLVSTSSIVSLRLSGPGSNSVTLTAAGLPGVQYTAQFSTSLIGPWLDFSTNFPGPGGIWTILDPAATNPTRFYRIRSP